jgi:hypothetical protein
VGRLLVLLLVFAGALWFLYWFRRTPATQVSRALRRAALWGAIGLLLLATLTGRLNPIFAALAAAIPVGIRILNLLHMLPMLQRVLQSLGLGGLAAGIPGAGSGAGRRSSIRTRYLGMTLDHDTGAMDGEVLEGPFQGQRLGALGLEQLLRMLELYQDSDQQSASVLTAYLEREHPDWREQASQRTGEWQEGRASSGGASAAARPMTRADALAILGLEPGADPDQVRAAHRRLMQKLHPDRGGSDYLAAQINAAKDLLLGD